MKKEEDGERGKSAFSHHLTHFKSDSALVLVVLQPAAIVERSHWRGLLARRCEALFGHTK